MLVKYWSEMQWWTIDNSVKKSQDISEHATFFFPVDVVVLHDIVLANCALTAFCQRVYVAFKDTAKHLSCCCCCCCCCTCDCLLIVLAATHIMTSAKVANSQRIGTITTTVHTAPQLSNSS